MGRLVGRSVRPGAARPAPGPHGWLWACAARGAGRFGRGRRTLTKNLVKISTNNNFHEKVRQNENRFENHSFIVTHFDELFRQNQNHSDENFRQNRISSEWGLQAHPRGRSKGAAAGAAIVGKPVRAWVTAVGNISLGEGARVHGLLHVRGAVRGGARLFGALV